MACIEKQRMVDIAMDQDASDEERDHIDSCENCQRSLKLTKIVTESATLQCAVAKKIADLVTRHDLTEEDHRHMNNCEECKKAVNILLRYMEMRFEELGAESEDLTPTF